MSKTPKGDSLDCALRDLLFECDSALLFVAKWCNSCIVEASKGSDGLCFARPSRDFVEKARRSHEEEEYCRDRLWAVSSECRILYRYKSVKTSQFVRKQGGIEVFYEKNTFVTI